MNELQKFFNELNIFFDHIYIITLRRATERHEHIQKELEGLQYELFFGKDNQEFSIEDLIAKNIYDEDLAKKSHRYGKKMSPGVIGCSWSHALVYDDVIKNNYNRVLIMEDDVAINRNVVYLFPGIVKELPADWELLYLGFHKNETAPPIAPLKKLFYHVIRFFKGIKFSHRTIKNLYPKKIGKYVYRSGLHDSTYAYAITFSGAKKLLQLQTPVSFVADSLLAYAVTNKILNGYIILPQIMDQMSFLPGAHSYAGE